MSKHSKTITDKIYAVCGLYVEPTDVPDALPDDLIIQVGEGRSVFAVECAGKMCAFSINSADRATVALAKEYVSGLIERMTASDDPARAYLNGSGDIPPGIHVGKDDYYVFAVFGGAKHKNVCEYLTAMATADDLVADMTENVTAFCKKADDDNDYQSPGEFAAVLRENISEEMEGDIKIGVGGVAHGVSELPLYYAYARSALVSGAEFDPGSSIYSYKEYALIKLLSELPAVVTEKYVKTVLDKNYRIVLADAELMTAADVFIKHSLNISEASRSMYVHRNTLIYRLDKIEKLTGLNIRNFNDAMTFRAAYLIYKSML